MLSSLALLLGIRYTTMQTKWVGEEVLNCSRNSLLAAFSPKSVAAPVIFVEQLASTTRKKFLCLHYLVHSELSLIFQLSKSFLYFHCYLEHSNEILLLMDAVVHK